MIGGLVAKTLTTASTNPYAQGGAGARAAPVALDVFSVQVSSFVQSCPLCTLALHAPCHMLEDFTHRLCINSHDDDDDDDGDNNV